MMTVIDTGGKSCSLRSDRELSLYWRAISGPSFDRARQRVAKGSARKEGARIADAVPLTNPGIHTHTTK